MSKPTVTYLTSLVLALALAFSTGCSDKEESADEQTDTGGVTDPADASDPSDTTDPTDPTDASDPTDPTDPDTPSEPMSCGEFLSCAEACSDSEDDTCFSECEDATAPEALEQAYAYFTCMEDCSNLESGEVDGCMLELCDPLYLQCALPRACKDGCGHLTDLCGDELPLSRERTRHYWSGGAQHRVYESAREVVIAWHDDTRGLPHKLTGVTELTHYTPLSSRNMTKVTLGAEQVDTDLLLQVLRSHPAIAHIYPVLTTPAGQTLLTTNEIVARFSSPQHLVAAQTKLAAINLETVRSVRGLEHTWVLKSTAADAMVAAERLLASGTVKWTHPNFLRHYAPRRVPNDTYFTHQWHLHNPGAQPRTLAGADMRAVAAWDMSFGSSDVLIAINDDGVDLAHPDLTLLRDDEGNPVTINGPADIEAALPEGCCMHGTSVAGVAGATGDNGIGTAGVCPSCTTLPVFTDWSNPSEDAAVAETFSESDAAGAWVINNSWGPMDGLPPVIEAEQPEAETLPDVITDVLESVATTGRGGLGVSIVFAAGNGNESVSSDPFVTNPNTIGVAAVNSEGRKSFYSDFGDGVWVAAPSDGAIGIVTSDIRGDYGYNGTGEDMLDPSGNTTDAFGGTSSAAPAVSGLLGLIYSANPALTAAQAKDILRRTSRKIDLHHGNYTADTDGFLWSPYYGYGLVDAHAAVRAALIGCSDASTEFCEPAATCDDGPLENVPEVCNGIDDDCDGETDEEACSDTPSDCAACDLTGTCDGGCTYLPDDPSPGCLSACSDETPCSEGYSCSGGLCTPDAGRCSEPTEEVCDGRDNDANGVIDDGACTQGDGESCQYDGECPEDFVCQYGRCFQTCEGAEDCGDSDACLALADPYGQPLDTSVCAPSFDFDFTCEEGCLFLYQNAPEPLFEALIGCVMDATTCEEAEGCIPN